MKEWSLKIKERANFKCEYCGEGGKYLNSHHIIGRRYKPLRFDIMNGICLHARCHKFLPGAAAHENPILFIEWLRAYRPKQFYYLVKFFNKEEI